MTRSALIVAHGQPSDPASPEAEMAALAAHVAERLPGWTVRSATLAAPGALDVALSALDAPRVFPFFMADGWFTETELPRRLSAAGHAGLPVLTPFGLLPDTAALAARLCLSAALGRGWPERDTTLVLAGHGSGRSRRPAEVTGMLAKTIAARTGFTDIRTGFIEEAPYIADVLADTGPRSICLPCFVARWGHVIDDLPAAARASDYGGAMLDPLGLASEVPEIIARAISSG